MSNKTGDTLLKSYENAITFPSSFPKTYATFLKCNIMYENLLEIVRKQHKAAFVSFSNILHLTKFPLHNHNIFEKSEKPVRACCVSLLKGERALLLLPAL